MKVTEQELAQLTEFQNQQLELVSQLGQIGYQKFLLEEQDSQLKHLLKELSAAQQEYGEQLSKVYGDGYVDIAKGEFVKSS